MASILLDTIINETVHNLRGHEPMNGDNLLQITATPAATAITSRISNNSTLVYDDQLHTTTSSLAANSSLLSSSLSTSQYASLQQLDQLDGLASMMQDVEMGQRERLFWILLFSLMVLVAAGGNLIVIYIVSTNKEMKSVTNYFLVNLSWADTMVSTLNVIFNFISMLNSHWPFGSVYCKISNFIAILSISASVFTLTAISCDRYNAILHPLRPRMSHRHALGWILLIWTLSAALAMPNIVYSIVVEDRLVNENLALTCTMIWPDGRYPLSSYDHIYNIVILVLTYLVPILTMAILYYNVGKELWGYEAIGENVEKQARALLAKKKIVKMMIVVVIIFALCWLPYHAFFVVNYYLPTIFQDGPLLYKRCYLIMYWLAMSNSMYNPIIIYFMNSKFCHEFKRVLCFIFCFRVYSPPIKSDSTGQIHTHNNHSSSYHYTANSSMRDTTTTTAHSVRQKVILRRQVNLFGAQQELAKSACQLSKLVIGVPNVNGSQQSDSCSTNPSQKQQQTFSSPIEVIVTQSNDNDNCDSSTNLNEMHSGASTGGARGQNHHNHRQHQTTTVAGGGKCPVQINDINNTSRHLKDNVDNQKVEEEHPELEPFLKSTLTAHETSKGASMSRTTNNNSSSSDSGTANKVWI